MSSSNNNKKEEKSAQAEKQQKGKQKADENQLSEEDEKKKQELELIVQRLQDTKPGVQKLALETLRAELRSSSSSVTSIPKPLKFMGAHYDTLKKIFETMEKGDSKTLLADILSVLAMTWSKDSTREGLRFKLEGSDEFTEWGHEYLRFLSGEIAQEYQSRYDQKEELTEEDVSDILKIADKIIPLMIKANSEPDACDLLLEIERLENIVQYCDNNNYSRVCLYLQSASKYFLEPENIQILQVVYKILRKLDKFPEALRIAVMMNDSASIQNTFTSCTDLVVKKQMAFMLARHNIKLGEENPEEISEDLTEDDLELQSIMGNKRLGEHFLYLAKELDSLDPKTPEDIYKSHLTETRSTLAQNIDSARQNLASTFVNAFVNAGFGNDKLLKQEGTKWIFKNKDSGMLSATASLGMLYLWNVDEGLSEADKYQHSGENYIKAGALLAFGIINSGVRDMDAAYALLSEHIMGNNRDIRLGAILGLGIAYAGSSRSTVNELLMPILADSDQPIEIVAFTALALGMVFVGTCNEDISGTIIQVLMERDEKTLTSTVTRFLVLALGLLFLGKQETAEATIETCKTLNEKIAKYAGMVVETCAYAGTGNVLKIQQLLKTCGEHIEEGKENKHQAVAVLGIALIAMGEELGSDMAVRSYDHLLQYGDAVVKRAVPLAIGLLNVSNPKMTLMDTLSKLSHDADSEVAQSAILALGLIGAGTNNARIAQLLRQLSSFYAKEPNTLFMVRIAQGILFAAKGLVTMSPYYSDRSIMQPVVVAGLLTVLHASLDIKNTLLGHYHYLLYFLSSAMRPRMLVTLDESLNPLPVSVRVGTAVDTVAQAGRPKTITGFQTHNTPVLLQYEDRAELATEEYIPVSSVLEDVVILRKNPEFRE